MRRAALPSSPRPAGRRGRGGARSAGRPAAAVAPRPRPAGRRDAAGRPGPLPRHPGRLRRLPQPPGRRSPMPAACRCATPFGTIYSANITPDRETGIGDLDRRPVLERHAQRRRAPTAPSSIRPSPIPTSPTSPGPSPTRSTPICSTVPPVSYRPPANRLPFPLNIRAAGGVLERALLQARTRRRPTGPDSRGQHIVQGLGHCGACHTPKTFLGGDKAGHELEGGKLDNWFAPGLNADAAPRPGRLVARPTSPNT